MIAFHACDTLYRKPRLAARVDAGRVRRHAGRCSGTLPAAILTMIASMQFAPRPIWDAVNESKQESTQHFQDRPHE
jgi:hypothetical protein